MKLHLAFAAGSLLLVAAVACTGADPSDDEAYASDPLGNPDGDCLVNRDEGIYGTDPEAADTDEDGFDDCAERACVSDPTDPTQSCYACGWKHNDPGTLVSTGSEEGDVVANLEFVDQCNEKVHLWDFSGSYVILFITSTFCAPCVLEAGTLADKAASFTERTGVPLNYVAVLLSDGSGEPADPSDAERFAEMSESGPTIPVTIDPEQTVIDATTWSGGRLPGKCILSPEMELLGCYGGHDDGDAFVTIRHHAQARR